MSEAAQADRIIVMNAGHVLSDSTPRELFADMELIDRAGLELPPVVELREKLGLPDHVMSEEDLIAELKKICR